MIARIINVITDNEFTYHTVHWPPRLIKIIFSVLSTVIFLLVASISVIEALINLVNEPEPEHPLRADLAEDYTKDRKKFMKNAEEFTKKNSEKRPAD